MVDVSAKHLEGPKGWTPVFQNNFQIEIGDFDNIQLAVQSVSGLEITIEKGTIQYLNRKIHYASAVEYGDITVTMNDYVDSGVATNIYDWYKEIYDEDTDAIKAGYKKEGTLIYLGPDFEKVRSFSLKGIFPTTFNFGDLAMTAQGDPVEISMTLSVDKAVLQ